MPKFVSGPVAVGHVVKDYYIGSVRVVICDDAYRDRSEEDRKRSLLNMSRIVSEALASKAAEESASDRRLGIE